MTWLWILAALFNLGLLGLLMLRLVDTSRWKGTPGPHGPVRVTRNKDRVLAVAAGVAAPGALAFELRPESWFDRWFKHWGLAVEGQAGHANFDRTYFLLGDEPALVERLRQNRALCNRMLELSGPGVPPGYTFVRVVCAGDTLWTEYAWGRPFADADVDKLVGGLQLRLQSIARDLPTGVPGAADAKRRAAKRLELAALGLFLAAIAIGITLWATGLPQIVDRGRLWAYAAVLTALCLLAVFDWARRHVGRSSRAHGLFALWALLGAPSALVCAMLLVRQANVWLDPYDGYLRFGGVTGHEVSKSRKLPRRYAAEVFLLPPDHGPNRGVDQLRLRLDREDFGRLPLLGGVQVIERPGLLGLRWIERVDEGDEWRRKFGLDGDASR